jgi:hypothetical protein
MLRTAAVVAAVVAAASAQVTDNRPYGENGAFFPDPGSKPTASDSKLTLISRALGGSGNASTLNDVLSNVFPEAWVQSDGLLVGPTTIGAGQRNCMISTKMPDKPRSLSFCHKFNDKACCIPQLDDENNEFFGQLTNLGLSCRIRGDIREDPLAKLYCLNCDPQQPRYIRPTMAINNNTEGNPIANIPADSAGNTMGVANAVNNGEFNQVLVSRQWAETEFGTNPILSGPNDRFAKCGLLVSSPCQGDMGVLDNRDRYTCGDDLFVPPDAFKVLDANGHVNIVESFENMLNTPDLGTPQIDGAYYFKVVNDGACTDDQAKERANPDCLRTALQMTNIPITGLTTIDANTTYQDLVCNHDCSTVTCTTALMGATETGNTTLDGMLCCCYPWFDELAFNSGAIASPSMLLAAVLACIASLLLA